MNSVYIIVDIETDGPAPDFSSILSLAAVASTTDQDIGSFYQKMLPIPGKEGYLKTKQWWDKNPEAWNEATKEARDPVLVMNDFKDWVSGMGSMPIFVSHPIAFDYPFVASYLWRYCKVNPFTNDIGTPRTLDLPSYFAGKLNNHILKSTRRHIPESFLQGSPAHTHKAIDDAMGYSVLLRRALKYSTVTLKD